MQAQQQHTPRPLADQAPVTPIQVPPPSNPSTAPQPRTPKEQIAAPASYIATAVHQSIRLVASSSAKKLSVESFKAIASDSGSPSSPSRTAARYKPDEPEPGGDTTVPVPVTPKKIQLNTADSTASIDAKRVSPRGSVSKADIDGAVGGARERQ